MALWSTPLSRYSQMEESEEAGPILEDFRRYLYEYIWAMEIGGEKKASALFPLQIEQLGWQLLWWRWHREYYLRNINNKMPGYSISSDPDALEAYRIVFHHRRPFVFGHCSSDFSPANGLNLWRFPWPLGMAGASANLTGTGTDASAVRTQERSISVDSNRKASKLLGDFGHDHSIAPLFCAPSLTPPPILCGDLL